VDGLAGALEDTAAAAGRRSLSPLAMMTPIITPAASTTTSPTTAAAIRPGLL
jgi:hypothetical protein